MTLKFDIKDENELVYTDKFLSAAHRHGISIRYTTDRAALDLGLHLTVPLNDRFKGVTCSRVWFQFKGIEAGKNGISKEKFDAISEIPQSVKVEHLRQWCRYAEPVYLTVYLHAVDKFFALDIQEYAEARWRGGVFKDAPFTNEKGEVQESVTVYIPKTAEVDEDFWHRLGAHRSMRIDGASFQGRPLAHGHDAQTRVPRIMEPRLFEDTVGELLTAHRYRLYGTGDAYQIYPGGLAAGDVVSISIGKLFDPYQYEPYWTRELLPDADGYREDGQTHKIQGDCAVIIHSSVKTHPDVAMLRSLAQGLEARGIKNLLVFVNHYTSSLALVEGVGPYNCFPQYSEGVRGTRVSCVPQHLEDIGKTISLATNVYVNFRERIPWNDEVFEEKIKSGELRVVTPEEYYRELGRRKLLGD